MLRATALVISVVLVGASCGSDGAETAATTTETPVVETTVVATTEAVPTTESISPPTAPATTALDTTAPAPVTTEAPIPVDDGTVQESALIGPDDLGAGWVDTTGADDADDDESRRRVDECSGADPELSDFIQAQQSEISFGDPESGAEIEHSVILLPDEATAQQAIDEIAVPELPECYAQVVTEMISETMADPEQSDFPEGTKVGEMVMARVDANVDVGDVVRYDAELPISIGGTEYGLFFDLWFLREGRAISSVVIQTIDGVFPDEAVLALIEEIDRRLALIG